MAGRVLVAEVQTLVEQYWLLHYYCMLPLKSREVSAVAAYGPLGKGKLLLVSSWLKAGGIASR